MSIPADDWEGASAHRARLVVLALRTLAALSACVAIVALWSVEHTHVAHDLQLAVAGRARPGEQLALRAVLFRDVDTPEGPSLEIAPTTVHLLDAHDRELAVVHLAPTALTTLDGAIALPTSLSGRYALEARTSIEDELLRCRRVLDVTRDAPPERLHGREAGPLQQLSVGRVHVRGQLPAPEPLLPRVVGGACVPEQPCRLLVWVGEPAATLAVRAGAGVTLSEPPPRADTAGLVALTLVARGLDAQLTLEARRGGALVAERGVRLPMGHGEPRIEAAEGSLTQAPITLTFAPPPGRAHLIADLFAAGRWRASRVIADAAETRLTFQASELPPGLLRVQARTDRFAGEGAGARVLYLQAPGEDASRGLTVLARTLAQIPELAHEPTQRWGETLPTFAAAEPRKAAEFLLAALEQLRAPTPLPASGRPVALRQLDRTRVRLRYGVAVALVLSALVIAVSIARRGLSATEEAEAILDEERAPTEQSPRGVRLRARALVLLFVLAVTSAFLAGALLIVAKPLWF